jgi:hypothetical protein
MWHKVVEYQRLVVPSAGSGKARDSAPQRRQRRRISQLIALKRLASTAQNAVQRRGCAVLRRVSAVDLVSTCRLYRFSGSIRSGDGAVLLFDVGSKSLTDHQPLEVGRRHISAFGHGNRDDPEQSLSPKSSPIICLAKIEAANMSTINVSPGTFRQPQFNDLQQS